MLPYNHQDTGNRQDLLNHPNSYFSDLSDSLYSLKLTELSESSDPFMKNSIALSSMQILSKYSSCDLYRIKIREKIPFLKPGIEVKKKDANTDK